MGADTERAVPEGATPGRRTPTFTVDSVPPALLAAHHTTVWAELHVEVGSVTFVEEHPPQRFVLDAPAVIGIVPHRKHHVEPGDGAEFHVQFYDPA